MNKVNTKKGSIQCIIIIIIIMQFTAILARLSLNRLACQEMERCESPYQNFMRNFGNEENLMRRFGF